MGRLKAEKLALWDLMIEKMQEREVFYITDIAKDCGITYDRARCSIDELAAKRIVYFEKDLSRRRRLIRIDENARQYYEALWRKKI